MMKMVNKKTKIVATLGPASSSEDVLTEMIREGLDVCRINFSHGELEVHRKTIETIRKVNAQLNTHVAILGDLQGPKLRVGEVEKDTVLQNGETFVFTTKKRVGAKDGAYITYQKFPQDVKPGETVLLDDGKLQLEVVKTNQKDEVVTRVVQGGPLSSNKGVNLPNTKVSLPSLTEKDRKDLEFALEMNVDWIALSFVRSARDIIELRHIIRDKKKHTRIIAKIEKPEAIDDIDEIVAETDGMMVARGDLGVEVPMQKVPLLQKSMIQKCLNSAKPVIVATQMMESMITNITPTRAEVNDVANAVLDGADAVMLSAETSVGKFPVEVIRTMVKIVQEIEKFEGIYHHETVPVEPEQERYVTDSICFNASRLANRVNASAIVTMTHSGYTAFKISSSRPKADTFVFTGNREILTSLSLVWGVYAFYYDKVVSTDHTIADIIYLLKKEGLVKKGDFVVHTASMPIQEMGTTNMLKLSQA